MEIQTLAQRFYDFARLIRNYTPGTIKRYSDAINRYCRHAGITTIEEVTTDNVRALFYYGRAERHWSSNTFLVFHKSLLVFFRWCKQEGFLSHNPVEVIEKPKVEKKHPPRLTRQDAFRLLEIVDNYPYCNKYLRYRNHAIFSMYIFAGLRKSELLYLKYSDVDVENLTIFVKQGKGNKDRFIPMNETLAKTLQRYLDERKRLNKTCPEFFTSLHLNSGFTNSGLKHLLAQVIKASGLKFSIHRLRHTFATLMIEGGCDIYSLSRMMGHSDINITTVYLYASAELLRSQMVKHPLSEVVR